MTFDLGTINWQAISSVLLFLSILGAYIYPSFKSRRRLMITTRLEPNSQRLGYSTLFIYVFNPSNVPISIIEHGMICSFGSSRHYFTKKSNIEGLTEIKPHSNIVLLQEIENNVFGNIQNIYLRDSRHKIWKLSRASRRELIKWTKPLDEEEYKDVPI